jgi:DNA-binding response OmpR family regulator
LLVEDDVTLRRLFSKLIRQSGHLATDMRTAEEALVALCRDGVRPCLVVVDRGLPGMPGDRFALELRRHWVGTPPPLVFLTAWDCAKPAGFAEMLRKPLPDRDFQDLLRRHCSCAPTSGVLKIRRGAADPDDERQVG